MFETESIARGSVGDLSGFPFDAFDEVQAAVKARSFNIGVDPLAAAQWAERSGSRAGRTLVTGLSLLIIVAGVAAVVAAISIPNYYLLLAIPVQLASFYLSSSWGALRTYVTVGGAISVAAFLNLLLNGWVTGATLVAYAGLTFAAVRAAAFITSSSFRKALLADEHLFVAAYENGACSLRNAGTKREYRST
jgi:hypothetical protein